MKRCTNSSSKEQFDGSDIDAGERRITTAFVKRSKPELVVSIILKYQRKVNELKAEIERLKGEHNVHKSSSK